MQPDDNRLTESSSHPTCSENGGSPHEPTALQAVTNSDVYIRADGTQFGKNHRCFYEVSQLKLMKGPRGPVAPVILE